MRCNGPVGMLIAAVEMLLYQAAIAVMAVGLVLVSRRARRPRGRV